ncbi:MAG: hypothetical protein RSD82_05285, partial [Comamonas sp.]
MQRLHQGIGCEAIRQRQFAASEHQHVAHLMLQLVKALFKTPGKTLLSGDRQLLLSQMTGVEQSGGQWRADLMSQRGHHSPQRGQTFVARQLILQMTGFRQ